MTDDESLVDRIMALDASTLATIDEHGIQVMGVFAGADDPAPSSPFHYSIGLTALGSPEVVVCGLPMRVGHWLVNEIHRRVRDDGLVLTPGTPVLGILGGDSEYDGVVCAVTEDAEVYRIGSFFPEWSCVQVVYMDFGHNYPWDDAYGVDPRVQKDWYIRP